MYSRFLAVWILGFLAIPPQAAAHHSVGAVYDVSRLVELEPARDDPTDAATFTNPVTVKKRWIWLPDVNVSPYECTN